MLRQQRRLSLFSLLVAAGVTLVACGDDGGSPGSGSEPPDGPEPGFTVNAGSNLRTSESGDKAEFTVKLRSEPTDDVTIPISSDDESEGKIDKSELVFTPSNWDKVQKLTITGQDDDEADGDEKYQIILGKAKSNDDTYDGLNPSDVSVTNEDDDEPPKPPTADIEIDSEDDRTGEDGDAAVFSVVLSSKPESDVIITLRSSDESEGTLSESELVFTPDDWDEAQEVTVTGQDDDADDGDQPYEITFDVGSDDDAYDGFELDALGLTNIDDDGPTIVVSGEDLETGEDGDTAVLSLALSGEPSADVTVALQSSSDAEAVLSSAELVFTPENWDTPQQLTVTGVDDAVADGDQTYSIEFTLKSEDETYDALELTPLELTNKDDDTAAVLFEAADTETGEGGDTAIVSVSLGSQPTADVTVSVASSSNAEGLADPAELTFTAENWNTAQAVTVTGQDDDVTDGDQAFKLELQAAGDDAAYAALEKVELELTNKDDDVAALTITAPDLETSEAGDTAEISVQLAAKPTADVVITVTTDAAAEATAAPAELTFTAENWDTDQTFTVTGQDDADADGDQSYNVSFALASGNAAYHELAVDPIQMTNLDDE